MAPTRTWLAWLLTLGLAAACRGRAPAGPPVRRSVDAAPAAPAEGVWPGELCAALVGGAPELSIHYATCMDGLGCSAQVTGAEVALTTHGIGQIHSFCRSAWAEVARCPLAPPLAAGRYQVTVNGLGPALTIAVDPAGLPRCWAREVRP